MHSHQINNSFLGNIVSLRRRVESECRDGFFCAKFEQERDDVVTYGKNSANVINWLGLLDILYR